MEYIKSDVFLQIAHECNFDAKAIIAKIQADINPAYTASTTSVNNRISNYRRKGLLPLDSGNYVSLGEVLKGTSTLYSASGEIKQQWVKTDVPRQQQLDSYRQAISEMAKQLPVLPEVPVPSLPLNSDTATVYISNDIHFGALMWDKESGKDWNLDLAQATTKAAYDYLFSCSPSSEVGIVVDLGDLMEVDDYKNMTPHSGNVLAVDSRYPKILRAAYESLIYAIELALTKHKTVYFYNIAGNHDISSGDAVREVIRVKFMDNPRVIVDETPRPIKYHQHGSTLLQFAHGDGLKLHKAGEVMAHDCQDIFSSTTHRYSHFGHTHKDAVYEGPLTRAESHRNLASLNSWAYHKGFRGPLGTMKSITYHVNHGEISRSTFNVNMQ